MKRSNLSLPRKKVKKEISFSEKGTFASYYKAIGWLYENGYSYGSTSVHAPVGLLKGDYNIQKWHNLSKEDIDELDGVMMSDDFREGTVKLLFFK